MFYTSIKRSGNALLTRYIDDDGVKHQQRITNFKPVVFNQSSTDSGWSDLYGLRLSPKQFQTIAEYRDFLKNYDNVEGMKLWEVPIDLQYIISQYPRVIDWQYNKIKVFFIDIEVKVGTAFPDPNKAEQEITAITIYDSISKQYLIFGQKESNYKADNAQYFNCGNERKLLSAFLTFWESNHPDIVTGWNIDGFDIPYIVNRLTRIIDEDAPKRLSPWKMITIKESRDITKKVPDIEFLGVEILDFLDLYKKYVPIKQESYRLDYIVEKELGENKVDYVALGYKDFNDLYERNFDLYVEYNCHDVGLVVRLERKLKMIQLQCNLAYKAKINYKEAFSPVKAWGHLIKNELWYDKKVLFDPGRPGQDGEYEGAYVKTPISGMYEWVVSIDATSMYPTAIISYNISPETMVLPKDVPEDLEPYYRVSHVENLSNWELDATITNLLKEHNLTMAANGQLYRRDIEGILPRMTNKIFEERKFNKKKMLELKAKVESGELADSEELQDEIGGYSIAEKGLKVFLNSLYGAMANQFFPLYELYNAEAITLSGQAAIRAVSKKMSEYINRLAQTDKDNVIYIDTDSIYLDLSGMTKNLGLDVKQTIDVLAKFADSKINQKSSQICSDYGAQLNMRTMRLEFKREKIITRLVMISKKRYICLVGDSEGVRYKELEFSATGVETNRSSTPKYVRGKLEEAFRIILEKDNDDLLDFIDSVEQAFNTLPISDISFPRGVNGIEKYGNRTTIYSMKTPIHVRASLLYNHWIKMKGIDKQTPPIYEGQKIRFVYLKPNYTKEDVIAFSEDGLPPELGLDAFVDRHLQFEKSFLEPLKNVTEKIGWKHERSSDLSAFF